MKQCGQLILLVEDEPDLRELLTTVLVRAGYAVTAVGDGRTAHVVLQTFLCDVLVTDYHLPDTYGNALVEQAITDQPGISTVLISSESGVEALAQACGAHAWFWKGEMLSGLIAAVARACEHAALSKNGMMRLANGGAILQRG